MTPEQAKATAKAESIWKPAMELYEARNALFRAACMLPLAEAEAMAAMVKRLEERDIVRLARALLKLSDADLADVASYAEGLADWAMPGPSSQDGR